MYMNELLQSVGYKISTLPSETDDIYGFGKHVKQMSFYEKNDLETVVCKCIFNIKTSVVYDVLMIVMENTSTHVHRWVNKDIERSYCKAYKNAGLSIDSFGDKLYNMVQSDDAMLTLLKKSFINDDVYSTEDESIDESIKRYDAMSGEE